MLSSIGLEDFKSFRILEQLNIKPLTILCGANSSGKSSILKSLLILKQSYENSASNDTLTLNGIYSNNGFFSDVVHLQEGTFFKISNTFKIEDPYQGRSFLIAPTDTLQSYKALKKIYASKGQKVDSFEITTDITFYENVSAASFKNAIIKSYIISIISIINGEKIKSNISLERNGNSEKKFTLTWSNLPNTNIRFTSDKLSECHCYFYGLQLNNLYTERSSNTNLSETLPAIFSIFKIISQQYKAISYLGPLRNAPARSYIYNEQLANTGVSGEYTAQLIIQNKKKKISGLLPPESDNLLLKEPEKVIFSDALDKWLEYLNIKNFQVENISEFVKLKVFGDNIADVGFGIIQILPIITAGLCMNKEGTLLLEQPEIHLHPSLQMKIADFMLTLANQKKSIIVETHSDHIINRVVRRIMEDDNGDLINNVAIYYVSKRGKESNISTIRVDKYRGIVDAPDEFFTQYSNEVSQIMSIGLRNLQKKNEEK